MLVGQWPHWRAVFVVPARRRDCVIELLELLSGLLDDGRIDRRHTGSIIEGFSAAARQGPQHLHDYCATVISIIAPLRQAHRAHQDHP